MEFTNTIEAATDPAEEPWRNINAINDLVLAILTTTDKITISAIQGNAGAGGVMLALACRQGGLPTRCGAKSALQRNGKSVWE